MGLYFLSAETAPDYSVKNCANGRWNLPNSRMAVRRIARYGRRRSGNHRAALPNNVETDETPLHVLVEKELLPLREAAKRRKKEKCRRLGADELFAAFDLQQINIGKFSRRRFAIARRTRSRAAFGDSERYNRAPPDGNLVAGC